MNNQTDTQDTSDEPWRKLFWQVALELNCLPSSFVDGNEHVLRKARTLRAGPVGDEWFHDDSLRLVGWSYHSKGDGEGTYRLITPNDTYNPDAVTPDSMVPVYTRDGAGGAGQSPTVPTADELRYRWLRDHSEPAICAFYLSVGKAFDGVKFTRETVDEAIDAQIAALRSTLPQTTGGKGS